MIRADLVEAVGLARLQDILDYHSSVQQAAQTAARAGVKTLILNHPVPAPTPDTEPEWVAQAAEHFGGTIVVARDLTTIDGSDPTKVDVPG